MDDGKVHVLVADDIVTIDGQEVAIDAKFAQGNPMNWQGSLRNPSSSIGGMHFSLRAQADAIQQARNYRKRFGRVIYHSNSPDLIAHYSQVFRNEGLTNIDFIYTE